MQKDRRPAETCRHHHRTYSGPCPPPSSPPARAPPWARVLLRRLLGRVLSLDRVTVWPGAGGCGLGKGSRARQGMLSLSASYPACRPCYPACRMLSLAASYPACRIPCPAACRIHHGGSGSPSAVLEDPWGDNLRHSPRSFATSTSAEGSDLIPYSICMYESVHAFKRLSQHGADGIPQWDAPRSGHDPVCRGHIGQPVVWPLPEVP